VSRSEWASVYCVVTMADTARYLERRRNSCISSRGKSASLRRAGAQRAAASNGRPKRALLRWPPDSDSSLAARGARRASLRTPRPSRGAQNNVRTSRRAPRGGARSPGSAAEASEGGGGERGRRRRARAAECGRVEPAESGEGFVEAADDAQGAVRGGRSPEPPPDTRSAAILAVRVWLLLPMEQSGCAGCAGCDVVGLARLNINALQWTRRRALLRALRRACSAWH
jgi:hypothetical protein